MTININNQNFEFHIVLTLPGIDVVPSLPSGRDCVHVTDRNTLPQEVAGRLKRLLACGEDIEIFCDDSYTEFVLVLSSVSPLPVNGMSLTVLLCNSPSQYAELANVPADVKASWVIKARNILRDRLHIAKTFYADIEYLEV